MLSVFEESLNFERRHLIPLHTQEADNCKDGAGYDGWLLERKVKIPKRFEWDEGELGDSCCFGVRTVEIGMDGVRNLHGGI